MLKKERNRLTGDAMNRYTLRSVWTFLLLFVVVVIVAQTRGNRALWSDAIDLIVDARAIVLRGYVEEVDEQAMMEAAVRAMIQSLGDPHSAFISREEMPRWNEELEGAFSGIGATVEFKNERIHIIYPFDNSPAARAGVQPGDAVIEIEGKDTLGMNILDATSRLRGPEGTPVTIRVRRESGQEKTMTITRARIQVPIVRPLIREGVGPGYMIDQTHRIAYVRLDQFNRNSGDALREVLTDIQRQNPRGLILDMRFNRGGLLNEAVNISSLFLERNSPVVTVRGRAHAENTWRAAASGNLMPDVPVVVLVNELSASASEIVAGALKDNNRALIVGTRTFGKGTVQEVINLNDNRGMVKITTAHYHLPSGRNLNRMPDSVEWGVDPHDGAYVKMSTEEMQAMLEARRDLDAGQGEPLPRDINDEWVAKRMKDPQLAAALRALVGKIDDAAWPTVGSSSSVEITSSAQREALLRQRESAMDVLQRIDDQLQRLDHRENGNANGEEPGVSSDEDADAALPQPETDLEPALP
ncbi:MAG: S41 family peptidase [Phycisphaeraceae bacterium]|nr:S41 family peptidase [Phycisphaeraceae bacterium]